MTDHTHDDHEEIHRQLAIYRDLSQPERRQIDAHLATCGACAGRLADYRSIDRALRDAPDPLPDGDLRRGFYDAISPSVDSGHKAHPTGWARFPAALGRLAGVVVLLTLVGGVWLTFRNGPNLNPSGVAPTAVAPAMTTVGATAVPGTSTALPAGVQPADGSRIITDEGISFVPPIDWYSLGRSELEGGVQYVYRSAPVVDSLGIAGEIDFVVTTEEGTTIEGWIERQVPEVIVRERSDGLDVDGHLATRIDFDTHPDPTPREPSAGTYLVIEYGDGIVIISAFGPTWDDYAGHAEQVEDVFNSIRLLPSTRAWQTYRDEALGIELRHPLDWAEPGPGQDWVRGGATGYFHLSAASNVGPTLGEVCEMALHSGDKEMSAGMAPRFGDEPTLETLHIADQPACLIWPEIDPLSSAHADAMLIVTFPEEIAPRRFLQLWADTRHILGLGHTLRFIGLPPAPGSTAVPSPTFTPLPPGAEHDPGVADLLADPPAAGEVVEVDAYFSGAGAWPMRGGPRPLDDQVVCPMAWAAALTDRPFQATLNILNGTRSNVLPEDEPWLVAASPEAIEPGMRVDAELPYHARLRGYLGEPAFADCADAERIFVVQEVVEMYEAGPPHVAIDEMGLPGMKLPEGYDQWPRRHDDLHGYSIPYPPDWEVSRLDDVTTVFRGPQWSLNPVVVQVYPYETVYDQYDPGNAPELLRGESFGIYEQGMSFGLGGPDVQGLGGYAVERSRGDTSAIFSGHGHTYEIRLNYPTGFHASQELLTIYTAMVEGFRLDAGPVPTATPPVRQELADDTFLSEEEVIAIAEERAGSTGSADILSATLLPEADARGMAEACSTFSGHPEGVWVLLVRGEFEGQERTMRLFLDATTGEQLCGEETTSQNMMLIYTNREIGFALAYPADWHVSESPGLAIFTSYDPSAAPGSGGVPSDESKIDLVIDEAGGESVEEIAERVRSEVLVLNEETWELPGGISTLRMQVWSEMSGEMALLLTEIDGHTLRLQGYGDVTPFDTIARTLRQR